MRIGESDVEARLDEITKFRDRAPGDALVELARKAAVITDEDCRRIRAADAARDEAIQVDAFDPEEYRALVR
jgi:hypothetical protein